MVGTMVPVGHGERQRGGWAVSIWFHAAGNVIAAAGLGSLLGLLGSGLGLSLGSSASWMVLGGTAAIYSLNDLRLARVPAPQSTRQVPQQWRRRFSPRVYGFLYGLGLGVGFATRLTTASFYVALLAATLSGSPGVGAVLLGLYGLARALPVIWLGHTKTHNLDALLDWTESLGRLAPAVAVVTGLILASAGGYLLGGGAVLLGSR